MNLSLSISGESSLVRKFEAISVKTELGTRKAIVKTLIEIHEMALRLVASGPRTGRIYEKGGRLEPRRTHQASAKGEPPASDTGDLLTSLRWYIDTVGLWGQVGSDLKHAYWMEFGTDPHAGTNNPGIEPRPFLFPAAELSRRQMVEQVREDVAAALQALKV